ncbi:hypothetical protein COJ85_10720 [Bacillus sp. AFS076308]|uniref:hypothetical protein n=1 Tax=unclassified Bacillus (in: firmicutes) TaxID=185979 RepID=UPI000BF5E9EB|nr:MULTISPECIES: hypothetical protein [unclassified Bacillus (in: firmicutes)]PFO04732.1 hypothetical protein COJ85_10720 [Bacillus sp. AFS076308]PGV49826.1 hypothetical protein COD92_20860 [Bacillus sp. AFS037270]
MNRVGKHAASSPGDDLDLMNMVFELPEKDKMVMWSEGYLDLVIDKLPEFARDILENRKEKWEDTMAYYEKLLKEIVNQDDFKIKVKGERKEFALFVMEHFPELQSLLFLIYDDNLKEDDLRKYVYRRRFSSRKRYLH